MFPSVWVFTFWLIWPYIVIKQTQKFWLLFTGQPMPEDRADKLRKDLADVTRGMTKDRAARTSPRDQQLTRS